LSSANWIAYTTKWARDHAVLLSQTQPRAHTLNIVIDGRPYLGGQLQGLHIIRNIRKLSQQRKRPEPCPHPCLNQVSYRPKPLMLPQRHFDGVFVLDNANS
jgi:hypothetical protein